MKPGSTSWRAAFPNEDGTVEQVIYDDQEETYQFRTVQDVTSILERNKALQNAEDGGKWGKELGGRVCTIPAVVALLWKREGWPEKGKDLEGYRKFLRMKRADPDWRWIFTAPPRGQFRVGFGD